MSDNGRGTGGVARTRAQVQAERARDGARVGTERRRRLRNRLFPLVALIVVVVVLIVGSGGSGSGGGHQAAPATVPATTTTTTAPPYVPPSVAPVVSPPLTGEGVWTATDTWAPGPPSVMTTSFRTDPANPSFTAYASWMRSSSTQFALYPGYKGPGATPAGMDRGPEMIPASGRPFLLAAFNSGFYTADSAGGFYAHGNLYDPMVDGLATVVSRTDGSVDVVSWAGGRAPDASIVTARQNLPLLVEAGSPTAAVQAPATWGVTLGGVPRVWRTGLGVDAGGNLIYAAASFQTAESLAKVMVRLGAIRAMQLDINPEWPIFVTYGGPAAASPALIVPNPNQTASRFLYSSTKDFFALFQKQPGVTVQPW